MLKEVAVAKFVLLARDCPGSAQNIASLDTVKFGMAANSADSLFRDVWCWSFVWVQT